MIWPFHQLRLRVAVLLFSTAMGLTLFSTAQRQKRPAAGGQQSGLLSQQSQADADRKSAGCISCHTVTDEPTMHPSGTVRLGCADCHGGNPAVSLTAGSAPGSPGYVRTQSEAHPRPRLPELWSSAANPVRPYTKWLKEDFDYIRFVNPGDLRVAAQTCGAAGCHAQEVQVVRTCMMTHGGMLWGAVLYNNGSVPNKDPRFGESYSPEGLPQRLRAEPAPTAEEIRTKGVLPALEPLFHWETSQPGNVLRVFERGGRRRPELGNPTRQEEPGRPDAKVSDRGFGTLLRTDPVFLGVQKTRLHDPLLSLPGTNDHPGDYRNSGCTACHVVYANDRSPVHSGPYAGFGHTARSATKDPTVSKNERGHPIKHRFTRAIPSSQCMVCHIHPGTNMLTTYFGYTWWDNEVDGKNMYPTEQRDPTEEEKYHVAVRNPEGTAARGLWADPKFLEQVGSSEFNKQLKHTQFADFHGHGWIFRAVYKRDRKGNLLDAQGDIVSLDDPDRFQKAVHLKDIHLERGMHCVDCHFAQDNHGNGNLYGEVRAALEIDCTDCHGTVAAATRLVTSGPAAPVGGTRLDALRTPWGERRFEWRGGMLIQRSMVERGKQWEVVQVRDTVTPGSPRYNQKSQRAKLLGRDGKIHSPVSAPQDLAHSDSRMTCYSCHTSWTPNCFGCHLSMEANRKMPMQHNEGLETRNWTSYNFQVLRDDGYMLGIDGTVTGNRVAPARSSCAVLVSSQNQNREWLYYMQQTVAADGHSGQAFSTFVPHTVRTRETRACSDCHLSSASNNNAWMAQVLLQGTNLTNFMGPYVYVATGKKGLEAVAVAERDEPPAIIGSELHRIAYPRNFAAHIRRDSKLKEAHHHPAEDVLDLQLRGEYLYAALGQGGFRVFDVANIDNKGFSERIVTAPVSPLGQRLSVRTRFATAVASPSTLALDPARKQLPENEEQPIHPLYAFLYVTDLHEGLVVIGDPGPNSVSPGVSTLLDGNPGNNFLKRALAFNPEGSLNGARRITIAGTYAYILCDRGLAVVDLSNPLAPRITAEIGAPVLVEPRGVQVQFRYAFVVDREGLKVLDVTDLARPHRISGVLVPMEDAQNLYLARTYAYVAGGRQGLVIVDVEKPEQPRLDQVFDAGGKLSDTRDVKVGMTNASVFAYVADGKNGLHVVQLISPETVPGHYGFSPRPNPQLIATYQTHGPALAVSEGIDRDRAVDESGNQLAVFGRRGARPFNRAEAQRLYLRNGTPYTVDDVPRR